jgi:ribose 1,5-bisphosphokinase PhnN
MAHVVRDLLGRGVSVVAEGNFTADSGIVRDLPPCRIVQVHVTADPAVLAERLRSRDRHGVHYDTEAAGEIAERAAAGEWDALPLDGELVALDTTERFPDAHSIVARFVSH